jgi:hypothetical protein
MLLMLGALQSLNLNVTTETVAAGLAGGLAGVVMTKMPMWTSAAIGAVLGLALYILGCRI